MSNRTVYAALICLMGGRAFAGDCAPKLHASFDIIVEDKRILLPVRLGARPREYMELTIGGTIISGVLHSVSDEMALPRRSVGGNSTYYLDGGAVTEEVDMPIRLGDAASETATLGLMPNFPNGGSSVVGILGLDVLGKYDLELDLPHARMGLNEPGGCTPVWTRGPGVAALTMGFGGYERYVVPARLDDKDIDLYVALWSRSGLNYGGAEQLFGLKPRRDAQLELPAIRFSKLELGPVALADPELKIFDDMPCDEGRPHRPHEELPKCDVHPWMALGLPELKRLRIYLAFKDRKFYAVAAR